MFEVEEIFSSRWIKRGCHSCRQRLRRYMEETEGGVRGWGKSSPMALGPLSVDWRHLEDIALYCETTEYGRVKVLMTFAINLHVNT